MSPIRPVELYLLSFFLGGKPREFDAEVSIGVYSRYIQYMLRYPIKCSQIGKTPDTTII